jgi:uncharacterized protein (TIGR00661 family)
MKRVAYAVLDWGLGHATRSIPIIQALQRNDFEVLILGAGASLEVLKREFPSQKYYELPAYNPIYPKNGGMIWAMVRQLPKFFTVIRREHRILKEICQREKIDVIISDNRYGCWSQDIESIIITHQSNIQMPKRFGWLATVVRRTTFSLLKNFSECWVPDFQNSIVSGALSDFSQMETLNVRFIGPITRLKRKKDVELKYDVLAIFSGPEPQRSIFEHIVTKQLEESGMSFFIVRGLPFKIKSDKEDNAVNFVGMEKLETLIQSSQVVIARSGYSTVMDLIALKKSAILVPTPGQTEQEYLATMLHQKAWFYSVSQSEFNLRSALASVHDCKVPDDIDLDDHGALQDAICKLNARLLN